MFNESTGTATLQGTLIAGNAGQYGAPDVSGTFISLGHNLIGNSTSGTGFITTDLQNVNPQLGPLQLQGGPAPTLALLPGSPAIDAGATTSSATFSLPGLFAEYPLDGNVNDVTGSNSGTAHGNVAYAAGVAGQALQLNGQNSFASLPTSADIVGNGAFSIAVWIKTTSDGDIIEQRDANNFNGEYVLQVVGGKVAWWTYGDSQYGFNLTGSRSVNDGAWHFLVALRSPMARASSTSTARSTPRRRPRRSTLAADSTSLSALTSATSLSMIPRPISTA